MFHQSASAGGQKRCGALAIGRESGAMARAAYSNVVTDSFGNRLAGASVEVRQPGTATKVAGNLYATPGGVEALSNPLTADGQGFFIFYRDAPETVDLYVLAAGYTPLTVASASVANPARVIDGAQLLAGSVGTAELQDGGVASGDLADGAVTSAKIADGTITDADVASANKDGAAATPSLRTLGAGAQQAAAGNHGHTHGSLSGVGANDHHAQVHSLSGGDHTGTLALSQLPTVP